MGYSPLASGQIMATYVCAPYSLSHVLLELREFFAHIATAIAMGITVAAPFSGIDDQNLAIAYISAFLLVFFVSSYS